MRDTYRRDGDANTSLDRATSDVLSVVVPCYNEEACLRATHERLSAALAELSNVRYELIYVDDGSRDTTAELLRELYETDPHVTVVLLSRNFGHQVAVTAGIEHATGDAVVLIDADLQDPPEVIAEFVRYWRDGYEVVYGVRTEREGETRFKLWTATLFYRLIRRMTPIEIPEQAGDFRLLSRRAADAFARMPERARFIRGMTSWIGFAQTGVPYRREPRGAGATKYPLRRMVHFATDAITSFSTTPIRIVTGIGFASVIFCVAYLAWTLYVRLFTDTAVQGWASVIVLVLGFGGLQLVGLGIIGSYVGRIFEEVKQRPLYLVDEVVEPDTLEP
jgi:polyisoprenyl-phosphate glycosyltransferase